MFYSLRPYQDNRTLFYLNKLILHDLLYQILVLLIYTLPTFNVRSYHLPILEVKRRIVEVLLPADFFLFQHITYFFHPKVGCPKNPYLKTYISRIPSPEALIGLRLSAQVLTALLPISHISPCTISTLIIHSYRSFILVSSMALCLTRVRYRLYIKHHFRHPPVSQSVAIT